MRLYELAYACRLYRELASSDGGFDAAYTTIRQGLGQNADLSSEEQRHALMTFLNQWLCRIPRANFPSLKRKLQTWAAQWIAELPVTGRGIHSLTTEERMEIGDAYAALLKLGQGLHFQDTAAAKTLHVLRPDALPIWDSKIKTSFSREHPVNTEPSRLYSAFLSKVADEISELEQDVTRLNQSRSDVLRLVGRECGSFVKLVDEYNYVTITLNHVIPKPGELEQWLHWSR
ncbi:MAG: hypothetical protein ACLQBA_16785 [Candidatus Binataceae bacterium]